MVVVVVVVAVVVVVVVVVVAERLPFKIKYSETRRNGCSKTVVQKNHSITARGPQAVRT